MKRTARMVGSLLVWFLCAFGTLTARAGQLTFTPEEQAFISQNPVLRYGANPSAHPYSWSENGQDYGVAADYLQKIAQTIGVRLEFVFEPEWGKSIERLKNREIDLISQIAPSPDRKETMLFANPNLKLYYGVFTRADHPYIETIEDLRRKKVGVSQGFLIERLLSRDYPEVELVGHKSSFELAKMLTRGEVEAVVLNTGSMGYVAKQLGLRNIKLQASLPYEFSFSIAVRKDWPLLVSIINKAMAQITPEEDREIRNRWLYSPAYGYTENELLLTIGGLMLFALLAAFLLLVAHNRKLSVLLSAFASRSQETERSNADLEHFSYAISHDLQEPLRMISNYLRLFERRYGKDIPAEAREFIGFAQDGAKRMSLMITDLLEYSRVHSRAQEFLEISLNYPLAEALQNLNSAIEESGAEIETVSLPSLPCDPSQIMRLFQNLIGNAIKYRQKEIAPQIQITCVEKKDHWQINIKDNGIGIEASEISKLFKVFQRLSNAKPYEGSGVGLAVARRIVERHKGKIWVESSGAGLGCEFSFSLPKR